jgi:hypothetical protein
LPNINRHPAHRVLVNVPKHVNPQPGQVLFEQRAQELEADASLSIVVSGQAD